MFALKLTLIALLSLNMVFKMLLLYHSLYIRSLESVRKRLCRRRFAATPSGNVEPSV